MGGQFELNRGLRAHRTMASCVARLTWWAQRRGGTLPAAEQSFAVEVTPRWSEGGGQEGRCGEMQVWGDACVGRGDAGEGRGDARVGRCRCGEVHVWGDADVEGVCMRAVWGGVMGGKPADPARELAVAVLWGRAVVSGTPR